MKDPWEKEAGADGENHGGGYTRGGRTLLLSARDVGAGLAEYPYSFDGGRSWTADPEYEVRKSGVYEVLVRDVLGNVTSMDALVDKIDNEGPAVSFVLEPAPWYEGEARLRILAEDAEAGLHERAYSYDGGKTWQFYGQLVLRKPGEIRVLVRDAVGNRTYAVYQAEREDMTDEPSKEGRKGSRNHAIRRAGGGYEMEILSVLRRLSGLSAGFRMLVKFFHSAAGKAVLSVTALAVLLSAVSGLLYFTRMGVWVYGCDGRKRYTCLGCVLLYESQEGLRLRIPERLEEKARTGEYRLRPGRLFVRRHRGDSLLVELESDGKQVVVEISEKMDCSLQ